MSAARTWKRRLRTALDHAAWRLGVLAALQRRMRSGDTLLMYHRVLPAEQCRDYPLGSLVMPEELFRAQMAWLARHCEVLPVSALEPGGRSAGRPRVAVTFDDGYADNHELAAVILEEAGLRGTFFVTTEFVESGRPLWFDRAAAYYGRLPSEVVHSGGPRPGAPLGDWMAYLKGCEPDERERILDEWGELVGSDSDDLYRPMTPDAVADLARRGHEVGSHTVNHGLLPQLPDEALASELVRSRETLAEWTGTDIPGFCYPDGRFDDRVVRAVHAAGYRYACTTRNGINRADADPYRLTRVDMNPDRVSDRAGRHDPVGFRAELTRFREALR